MAGNLNDFMPNVCTQDVRKRQQCYESLSTYLSDPRSSLTCEDTDGFIGGLADWVSSSNYKISCNGLEILCLMVDRMGEEFRPHVNTVLTACVDRLGDAKQQVREQAQQLLLKLMMPASTPQYVFDRIMGTFNHKLTNVREGVLICLQNAINRYGARCLLLSKIVPSICKLLEDQSPQVREAAINTLSEIYRHVGEKVRMDLAKKNIPLQRLNQVYAKFDKVKASGNMLATADLGPSRGDRSDDEVDFVRPAANKGPPRKASSVASSTGSTGPVRKPTIRASSATVSSASTTGGVDEEFFYKAFEDVPRVQLFSSRDLTDHLTKCKDTLSDTNIAWEKRCDSLRQLRGLIVAGAVDYDDFYPFLRQLEPGLLNSVKDLRSQVVREGCITLAFYSQHLGSKFDHCAETMFPHLILLMPNSAKVMSFSSLVCIRLIIQNTFAPRLIPIVTSHMSAKASIIRRYCCEFLNQLLHSWPTHILEKHIANIQEAIKKGISDADSEARSLSRKAFWGFADHFKSQADSLLNSLDVAKQKMLEGELSNSSSSNSINSGDRLTASKLRSRSASQDRGFESSTLGRVGKKSAATRFRSSRSDTGGDMEVDDFEPTHEDLETFNDHPAMPTTTRNGIIRSSSAMDLAGGGCGIRTTPRAVPKRRSSSTLFAARLSNGSTQSLPRHSQISNAPTVSSTTSSRYYQQQRDHSTSRNRTRLGTSQSQPNSRSTSPTPRHSYLTHTTGASATAPKTPSRTRKSTLPRSQGTSRETSPSRTYGVPARERRYNGTKTSTSKPTTARTLKPSRDTEELLADALRQPIRKKYESFDSDDAGSETSSVCSERSYSSYGRTSEASSDLDKWSRGRLPTPTTKDMSEIISLLQSSSYQDRKEGLICLQNLLRQNRYLSRKELKKCTEIFTRMFHDPHSKVFSLFLETLVDLVVLHSRDLGDWLYILLSRLLSKMGADILGSIQSKVQIALDTVRVSFSSDLQFRILTKFLIDQTQAPSLKVKLAMLNFLNTLIAQMDPSDFSNSGDTRLVISRIITWTNEPISVAVRKASQSALLELFNLNAPEFSVMLSGLPKPFQDGATKILQSHLHQASTEPDVLTPRNVTSPQSGHNRRLSSRGPYQRDEADTENRNPEDFYNSIKKMSADIQNLSYNSKLDSYEDVKKKREFTSQDSGIQDLRNDSPDAGDSCKKQLYYPSQYQDEDMGNGYTTGGLAEAYVSESSFDQDLFITKRRPRDKSEGEGTMDQEDEIGRILHELSNHNDRNEERKTAMKSLIRLTQEGAISLWEDHFKTVLLILLETLGDEDNQVKTLALKTLREILINQPQRFEEYAELTLLRVLEAHKDTASDVRKAAEDCAATLASYIPPEQTIRILIPLVQTAQFPINLAAIKMQTRVIEQLESHVIDPMLPQMTPGLLKGYDDSESSVRKASVFCLVALYMVVGEKLREFLTDLYSNKVKLLNLYIKRAQAEKERKALSPQSQ